MGLMYCPLLFGDFANFCIVKRIPAQLSIAFHLPLLWLKLYFDN